MNTKTLALSLATDLNNTNVADGRHDQLVRELCGALIRRVDSDTTRYAMPSGRLAKSADKAIAAWREAAKA